VTIRTVASFAGLQLGWFACVLGAAHGHAWVGPPLVLAGLAVHLGFTPSGERATEGLVLASAALLGFVVDTLFLRGGVFTLGGAETSPAWLVVLWPNTAAATAPGGSLAALARRPLLAALLGAIAAPFSYDAGARLGALALGPGRALAIIAIVWTAVLPAFFGLRARREKPAAQ
jgi:hypothetical protein